MKGVEQLGAKVTIEHGYVHAKADNLIGTTIYLAGPHGPSLGATINVLLASTAAKGTTIIESASTEPEVEDTVNFLKAMGASIEGGGTSRLVIEGRKKLKGVEYSVIPDRVEAGTFMVAAAITKGDVTLKDVNAHHLSGVTDKLRQIGVTVDVSVRGLPGGGEGTYKPADVWVLPYPGFPTDMQAQMMALLATVPGISVVTETIWENRYMHVFELNRMGADINIDRSHAVVKGVPKLTGAPVMASDLRSPGAALILAGLVAEGETMIQRIYHLDRGYVRKSRKKLSALGRGYKTGGLNQEGRIGRHEKRTMDWFLKNIFFVATMVLVALKIMCDGKSDRTTPKSKDRAAVEKPTRRAALARAEGRGKPGLPDQKSLWPGTDPLEQAVDRIVEDVSARRATAPSFPIAENWMDSPPPLKTSV